MLSSIAGQHKRLAQFAASQETSGAQVSQANGPTSPDAASVATALTGVSGSVGMSSGMSLALMALPGDEGQSAASPQAASHIGQASTAAMTDADKMTASGSSAVAQLLNDLQSLVDVLGGGAPTDAGGGASPAGASASAISNTTTSVASTTTVQDTRPLATAPGHLVGPAAHTGTTGSQSSQPSRLSPQSQGSTIGTAGTEPAGTTGDISNRSTISGDAAAGDGLQAFMQQFAMAAYTSGYASGIETAATTSNTGTIA